MATIDLTPSTLSVRFARSEKVAGLLRDIVVPTSVIQDVTVEADGLRAAQGLRAPGLALPGRRKIGTWRGRGRRTAVSVTANQPALRIRLAGSKWDELLIGHPDADTLAALATRMTAN